MHIQDVTTIVGLAREWGLAPRRISDLFYSGRLDSTRCPNLAGRRLIPRDYIPEIRKALIEAGHILKETSEESQ